MTCRRETRWAGNGRVPRVFAWLVVVLLLGCGPALATVVKSFATMQKERIEARQARMQALHEQLAALPPIQAKGVAQGARRALVIGNDAYENLKPLERPLDDAGAIKTALETLGFTVTLASNLTTDRFDETLDAFYRSIREGDTVFLFYAGHGIAFENTNYLLPVDMPKIGSEEGRKLRREAVDAGEVLANLKSRGVAMALVVLDACRNDPFARDDTRGAVPMAGLAKMQPDRGMFVIYSAGVGQEALDRLGPDDADPASVFTRKFVPILTTPGLPLLDIAKRTQIEVENLASKVDHRQEPAFYDQVSGQYYFQPPRPRLFGVAIGVDDYIGRQIKGAVNDATLVAGALEKLGADKVVLLKNADARVQFIDYVFADLLEDAAPGDTIVFAYAGVSAQFPEAAKPPGAYREADGADEVLVLSGFDIAAARKDRSINRETVIFDDDLTRWMELASEKNVNVVLLVDGCHGGGLLDRPFANVSFIGASAEQERVSARLIRGQFDALASVAFADGITGAADLNKDGFVTQRELYLYIDATVFGQAGLKQNPQFSPPLHGGATDLPLFHLPAGPIVDKAELSPPPASP